METKKTRKIKSITLQFPNHFQHLPQILPQLIFSDSTRYRNHKLQQTINLLFLILIPKLILTCSPKLKETHKNQFRFKQKTSCNHVLFVLKETILNFTENISGVKISSLHAEKAFDKIWRDGLFFKLINKLEYSFWYILKVYYDSSHGIIELDCDHYSSIFPINVGVKQGGILSPSLFQVVIYELIHESINENVGAEFKNLNISIIVYADDIILICPIDFHLPELLNICENYSKNWRIKFNAYKSKIVEFG